MKVRLEHTNFLTMWSISTYISVPGSEWMLSKWWLTKLHRNYCLFLKDLLSNYLHIFLQVMSTICTLQPVRTLLASRSWWKMEKYTWLGSKESVATSYIELGHSKQICVKCLDQNFTFYYEEHQDLEIKLERRINVATPLCYVPPKLFSSFIFHSISIHLFHKSVFRLACSIWKYNSDTFSVVHVWEGMSEDIYNLKD